MKSTQNRISLKELVIIEKRLNEIKQLIPECKGFSQPLCKEDISLIINTFGKLKFQEHSLSVRFQNLTGEQLEKQNECDLIREELLKLKEENEGAFLQNNVGKVNTQLNSEIKLEKSSLKTQDLQENQRLLLQLYLQALNLAMVLCRAVNVINANSVYHQNDNSFANNLNLVKKAQQGFITRKKKELKTAFSSSKKMFRTELDNLEEIMSFSINLNDIKEILSRHIPESKVLDEVSVLIKADIITCFFLDIPELEVQIANIVNKKNVILDLNRIGNSVFQEKYSAISISAKEISTQINYLLGQCQDEMVRFYSNCTPYLRDLIHKSLPHELNPNTSTKDLNIKMPPKNIKRLSEESTSKYKVLDPNTKNTDEALKKRQEAPPQSKSFTKSSPQEIMTELNYLRIKMSELRRIERKVDAKPQKEYSKETKMGWARSLPQSSKHSSRPATVNFY